MICVLLSPVESRATYSISPILEKATQSFHRIHAMRIPSQCIFPSPMQAGLQIPAMESGSGKFGGRADGD